MKDYGHLLRDDPEWADRAAAFSERVRDVSELLAAAPPTAPRHPVRMRVAYHDACHLANAQAVRRQAPDLPRSHSELEPVEPGGRDVGLRPGRATVTAVIKARRATRRRA